MITVSWRPCTTCNTAGCEEQYDTQTGRVFESCPNTDEQGDRIKERWAESQNEFMTMEEFEDIFEDRDPFEFL